jgi:outer membrane protein assembly factor BamD
LKALPLRAKNRLNVKKIVLFISLMMLLLSSCGEYNKLLKSQDADLKYSYAKKYFNEKKYVKSATLLEEIVQYFRGRTEAEESLYLLAQSYYGQKDYVTASSYFTTYYNTYPKGEFTELARFYAAYGLYLDSPDTRLDQTQTHESIRQFLLYMEYYPQSERAAQAQDILFELQEKLANKEYLAAKLYYNLGTYMGNNYLACVITADNALKSYPDTKYREDLIYLMVAAKYELAIVSIEERLQGRYREVVDEYYNYMNEYPEGKYIRQVKKYFEYANNKIEKNY